VLKQFFQQLNLHDINQFDFEELLRNDRESFNNIRQLTPARFRFRIMDKNGHDIMNAAVADTNLVQKTDDDSTRVESQAAQIDSISHKTHWQCKEPSPATYCVV